MGTLDEKIKSYLMKPYRRVLIPAEEGGFTAEILEFPGCLAEGETPSEAFANLEEVAGEWLRAALEQEQEIPPPTEENSYGGKFALRLPRDLHRMAAIKALRDGVSLNTCLVSAISAWVGADNLLERLALRAEQRLTNHNLFNVLVVTGAQPFVQNLAMWTGADRGGEMTIHLGGKTQRITAAAK